MQTLAELSLLALLAYTLVGVAFGIAFVLRGVSVIDPAASTAGLGFKLTILPGCAALWPLLLVKWLRPKRSLRAGP